MSQPDGGPAFPYKVIDNSMRSNYNVPQQEGQHGMSVMWESVYATSMAGTVIR